MRETGKKCSVMRGDHVNKYFTYLEIKLKKFTNKFKLLTNW